MMKFKDNGEFIGVYGWDAFKGDDDVLMGALRKNEDDGYYWLHPARRINFTSKMLRDIAAKLSELNRGEQSNG